MISHTYESIDHIGGGLYGEPSTWRRFDDRSRDQVDQVFERRQLLLAGLLRRIRDEQLVLQHEPQLSPAAPDALIFVSGNIVIHKTVNRFT